MLRSKTSLAGSYRESTTTNIDRTLWRALLFCCIAAFASPATRAATTDLAAERKAALAEAEKASQHGPQTVQLRAQATLALPKGYVFVPQQQAETLLKVMGNVGGPTLLGMVFSEKDDAKWMAVVRYVDAGYIKDDDAKTWNADELLKNLQEGTTAQNEERRNRGIPEMEVVGWVQPPAYDGMTQRLAWSASTRDKNAQPGAGQGVNYNTYVLGREGYVSLNLVTDLTLIEQYRPDAQQLLASLNFNDGKRYADFNSSTDKIAEYGLAALIGGIAAKKLGLLAMVGVFLLKFWKAAALAVAGASAVFFRKKKPKDESTPPPTA
jgi:uncharacterized membrane-anchored protein